MEKLKFTGDLTNLKWFWSKEELSFRGMVWEEEEIRSRFPPAPAGFLSLAASHRDDAEAILDFFDEALVVLKVNKQFKGVVFFYQRQLLYVNRGDSVGDLYKLWEVTSRL